MKEMTMKDLQSFYLDMMEEIHTFCVKNDINYSLGYGTLIGAIRHKGFIPWDDDIDIVLPRPDYEKLCKTFTSTNGLRLFCPENDNIDIAFARICDMNNTIALAKTTPWVNIQTGAWIDVFPIDGIEENKEEAMHTIDEAHRLWKAVYPIRYAKTSFSKMPNLYRKIKLAGRKLLTINNHPNDKHVQLCKRIPFGKTRCCANLSYMEYRYKEIHNSYVFEEFIEADFEGRSFRIIKNYDEFLRDIYGDYMQLPPINQRVHKNGNNIFYWK